MQKEHAAFLGNLSGEQFATLYPETAEKVRKYYVSRASGGVRRGPPMRQPEANGDARPAPKERKHMTTSEVMAAFTAGKL